MAVICGPVTDTISYVSKLICGHLVKISNIYPYYETIEVMVDNQIISGIGNVSVALVPDFTTRATISLIGKNVGAGIATISFAIETIEVPPPVAEETHYLDIYLKPYSWYTPGGAADSIAAKLGDINGAILNLFSSVGISDYQYIGTEVLTEADKSGLVTIRIKLKQLSVMSMAVPLMAYITAIVAALLVIIIIIGVITGWKFTLAGAIEQITGKKYSTKEVITIVYDTVIKAQLDECDKNYPDPISVAGCQKSVICGAANGLTDALKMTGTDCDSLDINQKVDICLEAYNIDYDKAKYYACVRGIAKIAGDETKKKAPKEIDIATLLIYGGFFLAGLYIVSKPAEKIIPAIYEKEIERRRR